MKKITRNFRLFCVGILAIIPAAESAFAASITNLDTVPYDLHIKTGGQVQVVHIEPNRTWQTDSYHAAVRYKDNWMELDYDSNYAIWKGGTIVEQRQGPHTQGK